MIGAFVFKQYTRQTDIKWKKTFFFFFAYLYEQLFNLNTLRDSFYMHIFVHGAWARTDQLDGICLVLKEPRDKNMQSGLHVGDNW